MNSSALWKLVIVSLIFGFLANADPLRDEADRAYQRALVDPNLKMKIGIHTPWHIVHGVLAYGERLMLHDESTGKDISALEWLKRGGVWRGQPTMLAGPYGIYGHGLLTQFQGHRSQFAGYLSELPIGRDEVFQSWESSSRTWKAQTFSALFENVKKADLLRYTQADGEETSWALWALASYTEPDETWRNYLNETLSLEPLMEIEIARDIGQQPCGGLHSLYAMSKALAVRRAAGKPITGVWEKAARRETEYVQLAHRLQNQDGSFSSNYFASPGYSADPAARIPGNGHVLEWLMLVLPDSELSQPWVRLAVQSVAKDLLAVGITERDARAYLEEPQMPMKTDKKLSRRERKQREREQSTDPADALFKRYILVGSYFHAAHGVGMYLERTK